MTIQQLKKEVELTLHHNILSYWSEKMVDTANGGFLGRVSGTEQPDPETPKGAILNARILWAYSAAYRVTGNPQYLTMAQRTFQYIRDHFIDPQYGGVYWSLNPDGSALDTKKQIYAIGFTIYGLSEYARATGDKSAKQTAIGLFQDIEEHAYDAINNGYIEALTRDWQPIGDMRLSDKDENGSRTMNTHLHIIEPYTNLYRIWPDAQLRERLINLLHIFTDKLLNINTYHLDLFFNDEWQGKRNVESYGHDIEASWLLHETALVLCNTDTTTEQAEENKTILSHIERVIRKIAAAADEGLQADGSMIYEHWKDTHKTDRQRQWWVQCENIIGHIDLYQYFGDKAALQKAINCWVYVKQYLLDRENGEWYWSADEDGHPNTTDDKAGFWKCPYHNSRMCLELLERKF